MNIRSKSALLLVGYAFVAAMTPFGEPSVRAQAFIWSFTRPPSDAGPLTQASGHKPTGRAIRQGRAYPADDLERKNDPAPTGIRARERLQWTAGNSATPGQAAVPAISSAPLGLAALFGGLFGGDDDVSARRLWSGLFEPKPKAQANHAKNASTPIGQPTTPPIINRTTSAALPMISPSVGTRSRLQVSITPMTNVGPGAAANKASAREATATAPRQRNSKTSATKPLLNDVPIAPLE